MVQPDTGLCHVRSLDCRHGFYHSPWGSRSTVNSNARWNRVPQEESLPQKPYLRGKQVRSFRLWHVVNI